MLDEKKQIDEHELTNVLINGESDDNSVPATLEEEEAVIRKLDYRLIPFVFVLYTLAVLDRSNSGNAKLAGLEDDVDLSGNRYEWLGTCFYIAYILFQWTTAGWKHFKAYQWAPTVVFFWGFVATIQAATVTWDGLMTCRFFHGIAEAMFGPGVPLYLSYFYPRSRIGFRRGVFISGAAAAANAYGSTLAYGITQINGSIAPWKILFIIEGLPTCVLAIFAWFFLPDSIYTCRFFIEREKVVCSRMVAVNQIVEEGDGKQGVNFREFLQGFKDPKSYLPAMMYLSVNVSFASLPLFVPTVIEQLGTFSKVRSQGLSAPPCVLCFLTILLIAFVSDKMRMRGPFICGAALVAATGSILLATTSTSAARYTGVFLAVQSFVCVSLLLSWTANIHASESKRTSGYIILYTIGQCGPLVGTNIFPEEEGPYFRKGMWISTASCLLVALLSVMLSLILVRENRKNQRTGLLHDVGQVKDASDKGRGQEMRYRQIYRIGARSGNLSRETISSGYPPWGLKNCRSGT